MVVDFFLEVFMKLQVFFIELMGKTDPPPWAGTVGVFIGGLLQSAKGLGAWIPWTLVITVATFNLSVWGLFLILRGIRWVVGLFPTMGGG